MAGCGEDREERKHPGGKEGAAAQNAYNNVVATILRREGILGDIARSISDNVALEKLGRVGVLDEIKEELASSGVKFDVGALRRVARAAHSVRYTGREI